MRYRRHVFDERYFETRRMERANRRFASGTGTLHPNLNASNAVIHRRAGAGFGGLLGGEGRALPRAGETRRPARRPRNRVTAFVGDRHDGIVERRLNVRDAVRDVLSLTSARARRTLSHSELL